MPPTFLDISVVAIFAETSMYSVEYIAARRERCVYTVSVRSTDRSRLITLARTLERTGNGANRF